MFVRVKAYILLGFRTCFASIRHYISTRCLLLLAVVDLLSISQVHTEKSVKLTSHHRRQVSTVSFLGEFISFGLPVGFSGLTGGTTVLGFNQEDID